MRTFRIGGLARATRGFCSRAPAATRQNLRAATSWMPFSARVKWQTSDNGDEVVKCGGWLRVTAHRRGSRPCTAKQTHTRSALPGATRVLAWFDALESKGTHSRELARELRKRTDGGVSRVCDWSV